MGVAGLIFEPHPLSSANQCNFYRSTVDVFERLFDISTGFRFTKKTQKTQRVGSPDNPEVYISLDTQSIYNFVHLHYCATETGHGLLYGVKWLFLRGRGTR